jgi:flavorubredoxin
MRDGQVIELGKHRLSFLETPHVHHWDSMMVYEETTGSLFPADLFIQPGEQPAVVRENLGSEMCQLYREAGIFGGDKPVLQTVDRIERLAPRWVHPMHGGSMTGQTLAGYIAALRSQPFIYEGKLFGRPVPT